MSRWRFSHIALLWLGASLLTILVTVFDMRRVGNFAIWVPGPPSLWRIGAFLRAAAPVLPFATGAIILLPAIALGCTISWVILQFRGR